MTADYSVSCTSSRYHFAFIWALVMVFVYPLGCPLLYFHLLHTHRIAISSRNPDTSFFSVEDMTPDERKIYPLRFLFHSYHPHLWWWEMVETANRLLLTGILVLIEQGSAVQIVIGILLSLLFIFLYDLFSPFDDPVITSVKSISQWQIFFVFFIALLFKADFSSIDSAALTGTIIFVIFANLFFDFMKLFYSLYDNRRHTSPSPPLLREGCEDPMADGAERQQERSFVWTSGTKGRELSKSSEAPSSSLSRKDLEMTTSSPLAALSMGGPEIELDQYQDQDQDQDQDHV
jgi:hypothetical protein